MSGKSIYAYMSIGKAEMTIVRRTFNRNILFVVLISLFFRYWKMSSKIGIQYLDVRFISKII